MNKFLIGDKIVLKDNYYEILGRRSHPFSIHTDTWKFIENIPFVIVSDQHGIARYSGYESNNAIILGGDEFTDYVFPGEVFDLYKTDLFENSDDFLI